MLMILVSYILNKHNQTFKFNWLKCVDNQTIIKQEFSAIIFIVRLLWGASGFGDCWIFLHWFHQNGWAFCFSPGHKCGVDFFQCWEDTLDYYPELSILFNWVSMHSDDPQIFCIPQFFEFLEVGNIIGMNIKCFEILKATEIITELNQAIMR